MSELGIPSLSAVAAPDAVDVQSLSRLPSGRDRKAIEKTAKDFESVLLQKIMEEMRQTVPDSGLLECDSNDQIQGIFWMGMSQELGKQGGLGLWKQLARQMQATADRAEAARPENQELKP